MTDRGGVDETSIRGLASALFLLVLTSSVPVFAQGAGKAGGPEAEDRRAGDTRLQTTGQERAKAVACDSLVSLRLLTAAAPDRDVALARAVSQPGCRVVARADIGTIEHRAMIGGTPVECLAVRGAAACLWVQP